MKKDLITLVVDTSEMYDNFFASLKDPLFDAPSIFPHEVTNALIFGNGIAIKRAFKDGYTINLLPHEKFMSLEKNKSLCDIQILVYYKDRLIASVINEEILW